MYIKGRNGPWQFFLILTSVHIFYVYIGGHTHNIESTQCKMCTYIYTHYQCHGYLTLLKINQQRNIPTNSGYKMSENSLCYLRQPNLSWAGFSSLDCIGK